MLIPGGAILLFKPLGAKPPLEDRPSTPHVPLAGLALAIRVLIGLYHFTKNSQAALPDGLLALRRKAMKFRPLSARVVIRRVKEEQKTTGGIIIPERAADARLL